MKRVLKWALRIFLALLAVVVLLAVWLIWFQGRAPAPRPDLVTPVPAGVPPAPPGYATQNRALVAVLLKQIDLMDLHEPLLPGVIQEKDIEYGRVGDYSLQLDVYRPESLDKPVPGLIFIHGGAWAGGDRSMYHCYAMRFAKEGYVAATIEYRLVQEAKFPAAVEDCKCAVRWMRANAESLHVDPGRIAVIGGSAGGHLALLVGYSPDVPEFEGTCGHEGVSSAVAAVVDIYGPYDLTTPYARSTGAVTGFLGATYEENPTLFDRASPKKYLDITDPPTLILHGTIDQIVPVTQADALAEDLKRLGIPYLYDRLDGWPHAMDGARVVNQRLFAYMKAFFKAYLEKPSETH